MRPWWHKDNFMAAAEVIDALRIFPRLLICAYGWWVYVVTGFIVRSYFQLAPGDRTTAVTAFVSVVLPGIFGLAAVVFNSYSSGGYSWKEYREFNAAHPSPSVPDCVHSGSST